MLPAPKFKRDLLGPNKLTNGHQIVKRHGAVILGCFRLIGLKAIVQLATVSPGRGSRNYIVQPQPGGAAVKSTVSHSQTKLGF